MAHGFRTTLIIVALAFCLNTLVSLVLLVRSEIAIQRPVASTSMRINPFGPLVADDPGEISLLGDSIINTSPMQSVRANSAFYFNASQTSRTPSIAVSKASLMPSRTVTAGWPMNALEATATHDRTASTGYRSEGGLMVRSSLLRYLGEPSLRMIVLPCSPAWSGIAVNMCTHIAIVCALFAAARGFTHTTRRARSLCTACAYPITGLHQCPECGKRTGHRAATLEQAARP